MVTDEQRGRYGRWLRRERLARDWSVDRARAELARLGYRIGESSYAEWESGRKRPSRDALPHLVRLFGDPDPEMAPAGGASSSADTAGLFSRLDRLAAAMEEQNRLNSLTLQALDAAVRALAGDRLALGEPTETEAGR